MIVLDNMYSWYQSKVSPFRTKFCVCVLFSCMRHVCKHYRYLFPFMWVSSRAVEDYKWERRLYHSEMCQVWEVRTGRDVLKESA
jgi:hypothetical protein